METITIADNEKYLRQVSKQVIFPDEDLEQEIKLLEEGCRDNKALALASIQLRIPKRLIYLKNTNLELVKKIQTDSITEDDKNYNEERVLINPVIISKEGLTEYWETCASCLDNMGHVYRPYKILVEYFDKDGLKYIETFEGFESTVLSHEMDHLDGILHIDIADEIIVMPFEERKIFRQSHPYNILNKEGDFESLLEGIKTKNRI